MVEALDVKLDAASYVAKITIKGLGCDPRKVVNVESGKLPLARIFGKVASVRYKEDEKNGGMYVAFIGSFEAFNLETGEVYRSGVLYLPKGISEIMETAVTKLKKGEDDQESVISFAFEIRAVKATNPIGYSYEAQALQAPDKQDELAELRRQMLALPATGAKALGAGAAADEKKKGR